MRASSTLRLTAATTIAAAGLSAASAPAAHAVPSCASAQVRLVATGACAYGTLSRSWTGALRVNMTLVDTGNDGVRAHLDMRLHFRGASSASNLAVVNGYGRSVRVSRSISMPPEAYVSMRVCAAGRSCTPFRIVA